MTLPDRDVLVCRGCCCGTPRKHPGTDHAAQVERLEIVTADASVRVRVRVVDCLDACTHSNVVLVRDFTEGRRPRDTWLGSVVRPADTEAVADWAVRGGPVPERLKGHVFTQRRS